jgi:hypothetical protein
LFAAAEEAKLQQQQIMKPFTVLQYVIWILSPVLSFGAAYIIYRTKQNRLFPWFVAYLVFVSFDSYIQLAIHFLSPSIRFYSYWIGQSVAIALSLVVLYEIFRNVLTSGTLKISKSTFLLINAVLLLLAAGLALFQVKTSDYKVIYTILLFTRTVRIVQVGLMLILAVLSAFFGFYWNSLAFGIAAGFGFYAATELVNTTVRTLLGATGNQIFSWVSVLSFQCAIMVWLVYAAKGRKLPVMALPSDKVSQWSEPIERLIK